METLKRVKLKRLKEDDIILLSNDKYNRDDIIPLDSINIRYNSMKKLKRINLKRPKEDDIILLSNDKYNKDDITSLDNINYQYNSMLPLLPLQHVKMEKPKKIILVLGMINGDYDDYNIYNQYSIDFGQEYRDYIRILSLVDLGFTVFSMDDKHEPILGKHCNANFNDSRRMFIKMKTIYPINLKANFILLDYFFSPVSILLLYIIYE